MMGTDVTAGFRRDGLLRTSGESQTFAKICGGDSSPSFPAPTRGPCPTPGNGRHEFQSQNAYDSIHPSVDSSSADENGVTPTRVDPTRAATAGEGREACVRCRCVMWSESEISQPDYPPRVNGLGRRVPFGTCNAREDRCRGVGEPFCSRRGHNNDKHNPTTRRLLPGHRGIRHELRPDCTSVSECCCYESHHQMLRFQNNTSGSSCSQTSFEYSPKDTYSKIAKRSRCCTVAMVMTFAISSLGLSLGVFNFFLTKNLLCISREIDAGEEWNCYESLPELLAATEQNNKNQVEEKFVSSKTLEMRIIEALPQSQLSLNKPSGTFTLSKSGGSGKDTLKWGSIKEPGLYMGRNGEQVHVDISGKYSVYFELFAHKLPKVELFKSMGHKTQWLATAKGSGMGKISLRAIVQLDSHNSLYFSCNDTALLNRGVDASFILFMI